MILLGVGHDQNVGELVVVTVDEPEMSRKYIVAWLRAALHKLEEN
jgi:hypothetical protein